jgi:hypothetical protein
VIKRKIPVGAEAADLLIPPPPHDADRFGDNLICFVDCSAPAERFLFTLKRPLP